MEERAMQSGNARGWRAAALAAAVALAASAGVSQEVTPDEAARIEGALPEQPAVRPEKPRRLLVFTLTKGFAHGSIPIAAETLVRMGEQTGAWEAVVSADAAMFAPRSLAGFDAVAFDNTTGTLFEDPELRQSLLDFVAGGGGIVGIHAATDCFYDWPEFGELMGGWFDGHPWGANDTVTLEIVEPDHPLNAAFEGRPFTVKDEIYQFKAPYSRESLRVLLRLDVERTDMKKGGIRREDGDFAVSWVRSYGEGRVFYCSLGHRREIFWNPVVLRHYLDGIQFALGDLEADATPSALLVDEEQEAAELEEAFEALRAYEEGASRRPLSLIGEEVRRALREPARKRAVEKGLLDVVEDESATSAGRAFACRQLALIGEDDAISLSGPQVPMALGRLLGDEELAHMARYALERIPGEAAGGTLARALGELEGDLLVGVINSIGERRSALDLPHLVPLREHADPRVRAAAIEALGKIGGIAAGAVLGESLDAATEAADADMEGLAMVALLHCAEGLERDGEADLAARLYRKAWESDLGRPLRLAGLRGLVGLEPIRTAPIVVGLLAQEEPAWIGIAQRLIREAPGEAGVRAIASLLPEQVPSVQGHVIGALAQRGDPAALPEVTACTESADREVARAAVRALGALGDASSVPILAALAAFGAEDARNSLASLRGPGIDEAIVDKMAGADSYSRLELVRVLGVRRARGQTPALLRIAEGDGDADVRKAALAALGELAGGEHLPRLVDLLLDAPGEEEAETAADSLVSVCLGMEDVEGRSAPLVSALSRAGADRKPALLHALGRMGGASAFEAVCAALSEEGRIADAAARALAAWPDGPLAPELLAIARRTAIPGHRSAAIEGFVHAAPLPSERSPRETLSLYREALELAEDPRVLEAALEGLSAMPHAGALELAEGFLEDEALRRAAARAMVAVARAVGDQHRDEALAAIERARAACPDDEALRRAADEATGHVQRNEDFVRTWLFAGPYTKEKTGGGQLLDEAFPPEISGASGIEWRPVPPEALSAPGTCDLLKMGAGSDRCGYLLAEILSDTSQDVRFEIGSDDGVKLWLNGDLLHTNNAMRGLSVHQDEVSGRLKAGANRLMLKISQGGGDWAACCRVRSTEGLHLEGLRIRRPE